MKKWILTFRPDAHLESQDLGDVCPTTLNIPSLQDLEEQILNLASNHKERIEIDDRLSKNCAILISCSESFKNIIAEEDCVKEIVPR